MRNFEECKAEVFRRSEDRLKQIRKRRIHIAALCVPLILCLGIGFWAFSQGIFAAKNGAAPENAGWSESYREEYSYYMFDQDMTYSTNETPLSGAAIRVIFLHIEGQKYAISGDAAAQLCDILNNLAYSPHKVCRCLPQFKIETETAVYGIHLLEGYARCEAGQAKLTQQQKETIKAIVEWTKTQKPIG